MKVVTPKISLLITLAHSYACTLQSETFNPLFLNVC